MIEESHTNIGITDLPLDNTADVIRILMMTAERDHEMIAETTRGINTSRMMVMNGAPKTRRRVRRNQLVKKKNQILRLLVNLQKTPIPLMALL